MTFAKIRKPVRQRPVARLLRPAGARADELFVFDLVTPIDTTRWFICPTLTPLFYTEVYHELSVEHQRRYNHLTALSFSELISFFESSFAVSVIAALGKLRDTGIEPELAQCLEEFLAEETEHAKWWHELNRLSEPKLYSRTSHAILNISAMGRRLLDQITKHPSLFPAVFWIMLALEERSLEISRRCLALPRDEIEPRYRAIYRAHLAHEMQHVQIDWHLIDRYYAPRSSGLRRLNAEIFARAIKWLFLPPSRSAIQVVDRLLAERPELTPRRSVFREQLAQVGNTLEYQEMMYSRTSTPLTFSLFDRFPEMQIMRNVLQTYQPKEFAYVDC